MAMDFKCPICGKAVPSATSDADGSKRMNARFFPFCSQRCQMVDLGVWLEGDYRIPATGSDLGDTPLNDE